MYFCTFTLYQISTSTFDLPLAILVPLKSENASYAPAIICFLYVFFLFYYLKLLLPLPEEQFANTYILWCSYELSICFI